MKNKKLPSVVILLILTAITVVFWTLFSVYSIFSNKIGAVTTEDVSNPINPTIDENIVNMMKNKIYLQQ